MDAIDKKIIQNLQENARMPIKDISARIGLSSPAISIRIAKLEREGIISGYSMELNREKLGYHVTAYITVEMAPSLKEAFHDALVDCPNVLECSSVTGLCSQIVKAVFRSTAELDTFLTQIQTYGRTSTHIVLSEHIPPRDLLIDTL